MTNLRDRACKASEELQSAAHVTVRDVEVDTVDDDKAPVIEFELDGRPFTTLLQISRVLDTYELHVTQLRGDSPEVVTLESGQAVDVRDI